MIFLILLISSLLFLEKKTDIKENSALVLTIAGNVVEKERGIDPFSQFLDKSLGLDEFPSEILLQDILDVIHSAANDKRISCIVLNLKKMGNVGFNHLHIIGEALQQFKNSGKQIIAADDFYNQKQYFLASYANKIFLSPAGFVQIKGFGFFRLYFRDALEKLKINFHVVKVGDYKSAVEIFTRDSMSANARRQNKIWLSSLWNNYTQDITERRRLPPESLDNLANNISTKLLLTDGDMARLALENGLVDELKTRNEVRKFLTTLSASDPETDFRQVSLFDYLKKIKRSYLPAETTKDKVGIIIASGNIVDGKGPPGTLGGDSLSHIIRRAKHDKSIKAVVLRINSGGGSLFASEMIRYEILDLKKQGKPLVVSMGSIAASGGYLISADSDEIWASPVSLTGSIGIFGAFPTFENSLASIGIQSDGIETTNIASEANLTRPLSPIVKEAMQLRVNQGYKKFLTIVSKGRKINMESLESLAQGKVYTGKKAQELGLVDKLGTLEDAIKSAAEKAGLVDYTPQYVQRSSTLAEKLLLQFSTHVVSLIKIEQLPTPFINAIKRLHSSLSEQIHFNDPKGLYSQTMSYDFY